MIKYGLSVCGLTSIKNHFKLCNMTQKCYRIGYRIGGIRAGKEMMARGIMATKPGEGERSRVRLEDCAAGCQHLQHVCYIFAKLNSSNRRSLRLLAI